VLTRPLTFARAGRDPRLLPGVALDPARKSEFAAAIRPHNVAVEQRARDYQLALHASLASAILGRDVLTLTGAADDAGRLRDALSKEAGSRYLHARVVGTSPDQARVVVLSTRKGNARACFAAQDALRQADARRRAAAMHFKVQ
jgi:hypothetical protein